METKFKRVDAHSPGAIVPADYRAVLVYTRTNSDERYEALVEEHEELGLNWERACELLKTVPFFKHPRFDTDLLKCQVCGARFLTGQIWKHLPTGEHLILGCDCAGKYGLEMDLTEVELYKKRVAEARVRRLETQRKQAARLAFLAENPGLEEALNCDHDITKRMKASLAAWGNLSEKQVTLAFKIANEAGQKKEVVTENNVPAPEGVVTVVGMVVSTKAYEGNYGLSYKMTVKVVTNEGVWLCWGTIPSSIDDIAGLRGKTVKFTATLKRGKDAHFALFARPRKAEILTETAKLPF